MEAKREIVLEPGVRTNGLQRLVHSGTTLVILWTQFRYIHYGFCDCI